MLPYQMSEQTRTDNKSITLLQVFSTVLLPKPIKSPSCVEILILFLFFETDSKQKWTKGYLVGFTQYLTFLFFPKRTCKNHTHLNKWVRCATAMQPGVCVKEHLCDKEITPR